MLKSCCVMQNLLNKLEDELLKNKILVIKYLQTSLHICHTFQELRSNFSSIHVLYVNINQTRSYSNKTEYKYLMLCSIHVYLLVNTLNQLLVQ